MMLRLFIAFSVKANFAADLILIVHFWIVSFVVFSFVANWLFEGLQLDAQCQIKGSPYVINGLCHT